ncbi:MULTISPECIES: hypothetical protein [unclassified Rathayibacter]|uniref:hypothetical protein n=1 Tax=unclassified Rathayibacter TaxID=2609250 RepID=UPI0006FCD4A5|nr:MULTISPECIES: hypothetical protein [unclassified Rathayibacter]KQQ06110.1 hypothetical protein ASF42_06220 [Rathayibacter sp. Leaf294]KQS13967.1 hypothetical protein ASG06_06230 [Rathayibacter sp. Leaf185]
MTGLSELLLDTENIFRGFRATPPADEPELEAGAGPEAVEEWEKRSKRLARIRADIRSVQSQFYGLGEADHVRGASARLARLLADLIEWTALTTELPVGAVRSYGKPEDQAVRALYAGLASQEADGRTTFARASREELSLSIVPPKPERVLLLWSGTTKVFHQNVPGGADQGELAMVAGFRSRSPSVPSFAVACGDRRGLRLIDAELAGRPREVWVVLPSFAADLVERFGAGGEVTRVPPERVITLPQMLLEIRRHRRTSVDATDERLERMLTRASERRRGREAARREARDATLRGPRIEARLVALDGVDWDALTSDGLEGAGAPLGDPWLTDAVVLWLPRASRDEEALLLTSGRLGRDRCRQLVTTCLLLQLITEVGSLTSGDLGDQPPAVFSAWATAVLLLGG